MYVHHATSVTHKRFGFGLAGSDGSVRLCVPPWTLRRGAGSRSSEVKVLRASPLQLGHPGQAACWAVEVACIGYLDASNTVLAGNKRYR